MKSTFFLNCISLIKTYFDVKLTGHVMINYISISLMFNATLPLENRLECFPAGVLMAIFGVKNEDVVVQNTVM